MAGRIILKITSGQLSGKEFDFEEHDTFLFGRKKKDCHACLPNDPKVSRHHFLLEVNPPDARLKDLGSRNGTFVNETKHGGRLPDETPDQGFKQNHPQVDLAPGDIIRVGDTSMQVQWREPTAGIRPKTVLNEKLWETPSETEQRHATQLQSIIACQRCGRNVAEEVGLRTEGDYICANCRQQVSADPMSHVRQLIQKAEIDATAETKPILGGYDIKAKLGDGGMGVVYKAFENTTREPVAIKLMLSKIAVDPGARKSFLRECEILGQMAHPNIVGLRNTGTIGSAFYCVMDFCNGGCLNKQLHKKGGQLSWRKIGPLMLQALEGLEHAHGKGFVHRDIKPQNILLHQDNGKWIARIGDFGLAKSFQKAGLSGMTATGSFAGTYYYMPREQLTNYKYADPVSDIWSFGASIYRILTRQYPRNYDSEQDPMDVILEGTMIPIRDRLPEIDSKLAEAIDRSLFDEPKDRFQSATEFRQALQATL